LRFSSCSSSRPTGEKYAKLRVPFLDKGTERTYLWRGLRADMTLIGWIMFGLITGFVASRVVNQQGQGCILNVALGIVGACVGGFIFASIGGQGITGFNVYSMFVAVIGAIVVLIVYHAITGRRRLP
jgi:uncharacterized membrane protein YeaQ/YmgE (transglycosylase-associated protein family)